MESLEISDSIENRVLLAEECSEARIFGDAIALCKSCLSGVLETDPAIMEKLVYTYYESGSAAQAKQTLDSLIRSCPEYKSVEGHLLYARSLESMEQLDEACREYEALCQSYPGEQAQCLFKESLLRAKRAPTHYQKKQRKWLTIAQRALER
jgi:hypothetical protein